MALIHCRSESVSESESQSALLLLKADSDTDPESFMVGRKKDRASWKYLNGMEGNYAVS